ncbi:MAG: diaminopimelate epimerase [Eubacterium sp.]|jgi:diaminopimelate epimerase|nr:diaminopimelate epimerase [Eubacterium sp.]
MRFTKMHGLGNDYIYVNCLHETVENPAKLAVKLSDRHFGIGSDGLILIKPSALADFEMDIYNADGSRAQMCGNGIRCVGKYVYDKGLTKKKSLDIETLAGIKHLELTVQDEKTEQVIVEMGSPKFLASEIPVRTEEREMINAPLTVNGKQYPVTCLSVGNPHCVVFLKEEVKNLDLPSLGPAFERHEKFPERINTEFVNILDRKTIRMRVWERGSGETLACGTGACAAAAAAMANQLTEDEVTAQLLGGDLTVRWNQKENQIYMTGKAVTVFDGEIDI